MRIVCPACSAAYDVPDPLLGTGRPVRCARCGREWTPGAAAEADAGTRTGPTLPPRRPSIVERSGVERSGAERPGLEHSGLEHSGLEHSGEPPLADAELPLTVVEPPLGASRSDALAPLREHSVGLPDSEPTAARDADDRTRERTLVRLAWATSVLVILLLGWAAYEWRTPIMHAWPASERLYAALGLAGER